MSATLKSHLLLSALSVTWFAACYCVDAHATTIINTPIGGLPLAFWGPSSEGNQSYGLFFTAPEPILVDYSLTVGSESGAFPFVSQVYAWNGAETTGPALFTSTVDTTTTSLVTHTYTPDIRLTPGSEYIAFVTNQPEGLSLGGTGSGFMQNGTGPATFRFALRNPTLPGAWNESDDNNASFKAVFAVPEPSTWAMTLLGFAGFGIVGYRQMKRRAKPQAA
jgi:PEP-CTERM motif